MTLSSNLPREGDVVVAREVVVPELAVVSPARGVPDGLVAHRSREGHVVHDLYGVRLECGERQGFEQSNLYLRHFDITESQSPLHTPFLHLGFQHQSAAIRHGEQPADAPSVQDSVGAR